MKIKWTGPFGLLCLTLIGPAKYGAAQYTPQYVLQDNITDDARMLLRQQWFDLQGGAKACLDALGRYASAPSVNAETALIILTRTRPEPVRIIYQNTPGLWDLVAETSQNQFVNAAGTPLPTGAGMFAAADAKVGALFHDPTRAKLEALKKVSDAYVAKNYMQALYELLKAAGNINTYAGLQEMQLYRACYRNDRDQLFKLVNRRLSK